MTRSIIELNEECCYAEDRLCCVPFMVSPENYIIMLSVIMLNVIMLGVVAPKSLAGFKSANIFFCSLNPTSLALFSPQCKQGIKNTCRTSQEIGSG